MTGQPKIEKITAKDLAPLPNEAELAAEAEAYAASDADYSFYDPEAETGSADLGAAPSLADAIAALEVMGDETRAAEALAYHKTPRRYLGVGAPVIDDLASLWRAQSSVEERVALAEGLWASDIHEARIAAAKLLTQARLRPDAQAWDLICDWVQGFDAWAIADTVCKAGDRRLVAEPSRLDTVESWLGSENMWVRRAALVMTLPWTKQRNPSPAEAEVRARVLGWCVALAPDRDWFIQKAIATWLRELSKRDPDQVAAWLALHGAALKKFARIEAAKYLPVVEIEEVVEVEEIEPQSDLAQTPQEDTPQEDGTYRPFKGDPTL